MRKFDSIHIYPSNMKWETRIKKIVKSLIYLKIQKKIILVGINDTDLRKIYKYDKNIIIFLSKRKDFFLEKNLNKVINFFLLYFTVIIISNKFQFKFINPHSVSILPLALIIKLFKKN